MRENASFDYQRSSAIGCFNSSPLYDFAATKEPLLMRPLHFQSCARRNFLLAGIAVCGEWISGCDRDKEHSNTFELDGEVWISAAGADEATFGLAAVTAEGDVIEIPSGVRGHDVLGHPRHPERVLLVARAPGTQMVEFDLSTRSILRRIECQSGRFLGGHACFGPNSDVLFVTECDSETSEGFVVVRDAEDFRVLDEFSTYGIGPHQLLMMPDDRRLVVANGGLVTRDQEVLNLDTMRSTLALLDVTSGQLTDEFTVSEPKSSIRHLDVSPDGTVAVALQVQREATGHNDVVPLSAIYQEATGLRELTGPTELLSAMQDYVGSVKMEAESRTAAFSSPRGDLVAFWNVDSGELLGHHVFADVCGITVSRNRTFVLSSSSGLLRALDASSLAEVELPELSDPAVAWDNHMRTVVVPSKV